MSPSTSTRAATGRWPLSWRLYAFLVAPLVAVSLVVLIVTYQSLTTNASALTASLQIQAKANRILELLLIQDDATKAILIDPARLADYSDAKIAAYDQHKQLIQELLAAAPTPAVKAILDQLLDIDEKQLRPADTKILEKLFDDMDAARKSYFDNYEPNKKRYETLIRNLGEISNADANAAQISMRSLNSRSLLTVALALLLGIVVVSIAIHILAKQVTKSETNQKSLLGVLSDGLFFFDQAGAIAQSCGAFYQQSGIFAAVATQSFINSFANDLRAGGLEGTVVVRGACGGPFDGFAV